MEVFFEKLFTNPPKEICSQDIILNVNNIYYNRKMNYNPTIFYNLLIKVLQYGSLKLFNHCDVNKLSEIDYNLLQRYFNSFGFRIMYSFEPINDTTKILHVWFKPIIEIQLCNGSIIYK
jgi:hypothetical protein